MKKGIRDMLYPLVISLSRIFKKNTGIFSSNGKSSSGFYQLCAVQNNGSIFDFANLKGKMVLIVNTASGCGYTGQFSQLQELYNKCKANLEIMAFPANDFNDQEKLSDGDIAGFCSINYGATYPIMQKSIVVANQHQNEVFKWLCNPEQNGWNDKAPTWNFCKYLIDEKGNLTHFFEAAISPSDKEIAGLIN